MAKDKDPILVEKFFELLFPLVYPSESTDKIISDFVVNHLVKNDKLISISSLLESAISKNKGLERHDTMGQDFTDGSDAKTASVRWANSRKSYSAPISDIFNKKGLLRCVIYERQLDKFYYFLIPYDAYKHIPKSSNIEIPFNLDGIPKKDAKVKYVNWWQFEVLDFHGILSDEHIEFISNSSGVSSGGKNLVEDIIPL